jgi:hypothetical protein
MLVHTAVPNKWKEDLVIDEGEPKNFTMVAEKAPKARKSSYMPRNSVSESQMISPAVHNNRKRRFNDPVEEVEQILYDDPNQVLEGTEIVEQEVVYEEVTIPAVKEQKKQNFIILKPRTSDPAPKKIMNYIRPATTQKEGTSFFLTEEGNLASTSNRDQSIKVEKSEKRVLATQIPSPPLESFTEFIFSGELYVQMPKRVFEAERDRLRAEVDKYKEILMEIRSKADELLGD